MMTPIETSTGSDLRARISELRQKITTATAEYQTARAQAHSQELILLLRRKSSLVQQLFQAQSELLLAFRTESEGLRARSGDWA